MSEAPRSDAPPPRADADSSSTASALDAVEWEYDPDGGGDSASPLSATESWFRSFPWEGEDDDGHDDRHGGDRD